MLDKQFYKVNGRKGFFDKSVVFVPVIMEGHIVPEKNFKMTRYYGLYARHRKIDDKLYKAVHKSKHRIIFDLNTWRKRFLLTMGYDPLQCPDCKKEMLFLSCIINTNGFLWRNSIKGQ